MIYDIEKLAEELASLKLEGLTSQQVETKRSAALSATYRLMCRGK